MKNRYLILKPITAFKTNKNALTHLASTTLIALSLSVATPSLADTTAVPIKSLIEQCDFNKDGTVSTKKTWKTDGVSKQIAKKENSCKIDYENEIIKLRIAEGRKKLAQERAEIVSMLEPLSEKDLAREISKLDKRIKMTRFQVISAI